MIISKEELQKMLKETEDLLKRAEASFQQISGRKFLLIELIGKFNEKESKK